MNGKQVLFSIGIFIFLSLVYCPLALARELHFSANKTSLQLDDSITLVATYSGFLSGEKIFIKGAFYKDGSTNYFGYTNNGGQWVKNSATNISQREILVEDWNGSLEVKADFADPAFSGDGLYLLKIGYYYRDDNGAISAINWSANTASIQLTGPTPTPSSIPTPSIMQPTATVTNTLPSPTVSPGVSPTLKQITATSTIKPSISSKAIFVSPSKEVKGDNVPSNNENLMISGNGNNVEASDTLGLNPDKQDRAFFPYGIALVFIGIGSALLSIVVVIMKRNEKK
jgi:hypothetical protein